ncbi:hypothetical protein CIPAW_15G160400 [Carya illinoinensis]|uniref:Reverse transcriptase zinc-binding domain-containing protein n=1 Tax=Carya illinoinensis TaxID=32201 RepID=A0A8T1N831_CARIL|nr:hypothetical protein CIPAW_15G160400 [Carya illinoinensis]
MGSNGEEKKRKWVSWSKICLQMEEGGLGIQDLSDIQVSLLMKFAWKLLKGDSLWAYFFKAKYLGNKHLFSLISSLKGSRFWKSILRVLPLVLNNSRCLICGGESSFWLDNWLGDGVVANSEIVLGNPDLKIRDVVVNDKWDISTLRSVVEAEMVEKIASVPVRLRDSPDVYVWKSSDDGDFSTKSAWELVRNRGPICLWKTWLWQKAIPKKMSFVCWRARLHALPVDENICKLGIPLVSKCNCCDEAQVETLDHVLCSGVGARNVWNYFVGVFGIVLLQNRTWMGVVNVWWLRASTSSQVGWLCGAAPIITTWAIWRARCVARMEGILYDWK